MSGPSEGFCEWAAMQLMTQIRQGNMPGVVENTDFIWEPFISKLWGQVTNADKPIVMLMLRNHDTAMWGALLTRGIPDDDELTAELVELFNRSDGRERQAGLFHQIVARTIDEPTLLRMLDWLDENLAFFVDEQRAFFSPKETAIDRVRDRMTNPFFRNKRWIYLYSAHAAEDPEVIRAYVQPFVRDKNPLMAKAAERSLALLP